MLTYKKIQGMFSITEKQKVSSWIQTLGTVQMSFTNTNSSTTNNWLAHQIKTVAIAGGILNNKTFITWANTNMIKFITNSLYANGTCLDFKERDSLTYVTYTLNALVLAVQPLLDSLGVNYYTYVSSSKSSIKNCVYFLKPYIEGTKINLMFLNTIYPSDITQVHPGQYNKPWPKSDAKQLFLNSIPFDTTLQDYYNKYLSI